MVVNVDGLPGELDGFQTWTVLTTAQQLAIRNVPGSISSFKQGTKQHISGPI